MKKKIIAVQEPSVFTLQFPDGKEIDGCFNMKAVKIILEQFGDIMEIFQEVQNDIQNSISKLLFGCVQAFDKNKDILFEDIEQIVNAMSIESLYDLLEILTENLQDATKDITVLQKKNLMELLKKN